MPDDLGIAETSITHDFRQQEKSDQASQQSDRGDDEVTESATDRVGAQAGNDEGGQGSKESPQSLQVEMTSRL